MFSLMLTKSSGTCGTRHGSVQLVHLSICFFCFPHFTSLSGPLSLMRMLVYTCSMLQCSLCAFLHSGTNLRSRAHPLEKHI